MALTPAMAQGTEEAAIHQSLCFCGDPLPNCKSFIITEFGVGYRLNDSRRQGETAAWTLTTEVGAMFNTSEQSALGCAVLLRTDDDGSFLGLRPRYRRWITSGISVEFAPGVLVVGSDSFSPKLPGFSGRVSVNTDDLLALSLQLDVIPSDLYGTRKEWSVGLTGGSYIGLVAGGVMLILGTIAAISLSGGTL